jgi:(p)ppGpp synthase/HD superfamily hydrolase
MGARIEVQIRTREMHSHAELGVAAHWRYKEGSGATPEDQLRRKDRLAAAATDLARRGGRFL